MRKIIFLFITLFYCIKIEAQIVLSSDLNDAKSTPRDLNILKINLAAFALKNISIQYERAIGSKTTVAFNVNLLPKGSLPLLPQFEQIIDHDFTYQYAKKFQVSGVIITPEIRYYFGKSAFQGFYIAPFVRYENFNGNLPLEIELDSESTTMLPITGNLKSYSAGFSIGAQWKLTKQIYLDWMIMGPHYGFSNGSFAGKKDLSAYEIDEYKGELNNLDIPMLKITYEVNNQGATLRLKGPWAGIRAGLSLGYRF